MRKLPPGRACHHVFDEERQTLKLYNVDAADHADRPLVYHPRSPDGRGFITGLAALRAFEEREKKKR